METVFLLVYTYEVVKMLGGPLVCVQYYLVLILFDVNRGTHTPYVFMA
jgi:hypothetical protein